MVSNIAIRRATENDIEAIRRVARKSWHAAYDDFVADDVVDRMLEKGYDREFLEQAIASPEMALFVAEDDYSVVGYVSCEPPTDGDVGQISIYVTPDYWGEGIGSQLLERAKGYLDAKGADAMQDTVLAQNDVGNAFYRKHFEKSDETTVEMGADTYDANVYTAKM